MRPRYAALLALILGATLGAKADPSAKLVADIATTPDGFLSFLGLAEPPVVLGNRMYFPFDDGISGRELWTSDGTPESNHRVADICPGRCWSFIDEIAVAGDRLFFGADDGVHGSELWMSDGTAGGTHLVKDITPGLGFSRPQWITALGDRVFFQVRDAVHGKELWTSDGTAAGTHLVADLRPGPEGSSAHSLLALPDRMLFFADDGIHGMEPYSTNGEDVTSLGDLNPGPPSSFADSPYPFDPGIAALPDGRGIFSATDGDHGEELWVTDGTLGGTLLLEDIVPGPGSSGPSRFVVADGVLYFAAATPSTGSELWRADGTPEGTTLVTEVVPGPAASWVFPLAAVGSTVFFSTYSDLRGNELWRSQGTAATTIPLAEIWTSVESGAAAVGDRLLFFADDVVHGIEPWVSDGTPGGTHLLRDLRSGYLWSVAPYFQLPGATSLGDQAVFFAWSDSGIGLWTSRGTEQTTEEIRAAEDNESSAQYFYWVPTTEMVDARGVLFINSYETEDGIELWKTRGTPGTTALVADIRPGAESSSPRGLVSLDDRILFATAAAGSPEGELRSSDGTEPGTVLLADFEQISLPMIRSGDRVVLSAAESDHGEELWQTDGTPEGTSLIADLRPGDGGSHPTLLAVAGDKLFFTATADGSTSALWTFDGSEIAHIADLPAFWIDVTTALGSRLFFDLSTSETGTELWVGDGTDEGTHLVKEIQPGPGSGFNGNPPSDPPGPELVAAGQRVYFVGDDGTTGREVWSSDGSADNTTQVADLFPGPRGSEPRWLTAVGDRLFFVADDPVHGRELWRTDPAAGVVLVADILPGPESSRPSELAAVDGLLYFNAFRPGEGVELWVSDGTAAGTVLVQDIGPGAESSTPEKLTPSGRRLYFTAYDGEHGYEPWALLLPTRLPRGELSLTGDFHPGGLVTLTIHLVNPPPEALEDGIGDELVLTLPAELVPFAVSASTGEAALAASGAPRRLSAGTHVAGVTARDALLDGQVLTWNGSLPPGGETLITVRARIRPDAAPGALTLQGTLSFDSDGDGENDELLPTDDPAGGGNGDPTPIVILAPQSVLEIPTLSQLGLAGLFLLLLGAALRRLR